MQLFPLYVPYIALYEIIYLSPMLYHWFLFQNTLVLIESISTCSKNAIICRLITLAMVPYVFIEKLFIMTLCKHWCKDDVMLSCRFFIKWTIQFIIYGVCLFLTFLFQHYLPTLYQTQNKDLIDQTSSDINCV
jgi:hypothetical protein